MIDREMMHVFDCLSILMWIGFAGLVACALSGILKWLGK